MPGAIAIRVEDLRRQNDLFYLEDQKGRPRDPTSPFAYREMEIKPGEKVIGRNNQNYSLLNDFMEIRGKKIGLKENWPFTISEEHGTLFMLEGDLLYEGSGSHGTIYEGEVVKDALFALGPGDEIFLGLLKPKKRVCSFLRNLGDYLERIGRNRAQVDDCLEKGVLPMPGGAEATAKYRLKVVEASAPV